ncbi:MAG: riboflavin synthase [Bacteroidales bacterium]|jgi:riboflavin synthase|nr:riboflavin synthase [Bacteroidales bacterium]MCK4638383.1 riboflavin synthase [Bacteroidales bacterium]
MFTGIIEETGTIKSVKWDGKSAVIDIYALKILNDIKVGDSINTNGVCLTVTSFDSKYFSVDVMAETMRRTNLNSLKSGSKVNLERALNLNDRLGGHLVSGHIDGTGIIAELKKEDNSLWITIRVDESVLKYIVFKCSVSIDGISLTVAEVNNNRFKVSIIPHTAKETTLLSIKIGERVNIECDLIGKYVEKFITNAANIKQLSNIDMDFLRKNGF